jgi:ribosomal protein S18 acetylase RimI-like enzyme
MTGNTKILDKTVILPLVDELRKTAEYPGTRLEVTPDVVRLVDVSNGWDGMVIFSHMEETNADAVVSEQVDYFRGIHQDFEWKVYDHDRSTGLKKRLKGYGFSIEDDEAVLVLDLQSAPAVLREPIRLDVCRILDPVDLEKVRFVEAKIWNEDSAWVLNYLGNALAENPQCLSIYLASVDGHPASAAWIHFPQDSPFASLFGGSTLSEYRHRGLYTSLLAARAQEALQRGFRYLSVDAGPMSRPILEKFGFQLLGWSTPCKWKYQSG